MKKQTVSITEIKKLHQAGHLQAAKEAYLTLLSTKPNLVEALHGLGLIYAEEGDLDKAQDYLEQAVKLSSQEPTLTLHLANVLKAKGLFSQAVQLLLSIIEKHPSFAPGYNNLGTVYYAQAKLNDAVQTYQKAIDLRPDYTDAYYNLALALTKLNKKLEARHAYEAVIALNTDHAGARFQLGCLLMQMANYREALQQFSTIDHLHPHHFETKTNLATSYLKLGKLNEARDTYLAALKIEPQDIQILFNLGVIFMQQGNLEQAVQYYQSAVKLDPDLFAAHNNLAFAYLVMKQNELALHHFREALRLEPDNEAIAHTINILTHDKTITTSPPAYVRSLFNSYADHFDAHLVQVLHYQVPNLLLAALKKTNLILENLTILDLGCGTGLSGEAFKPLANRLIGVDISENMLNIADQKHIYQELIHADIVPYLQNAVETYDLILASDVLVYYGDLEAMFAAVAKLLKPGGIFLFNTEISDSEKFYLLPSGRFAHLRSYIDGLAHQYQFKIILEESATLRLQNETPVLGNIFILQTVNN